MLFPYYIILLQPILYRAATVIFLQSKSNCITPALKALYELSHPLQEYSSITYHFIIRAGKILQDLASVLFSFFHSCSHVTS